MKNLEKSSLKCHYVELMKHLKENFNFEKLKFEVEDVTCHVNIVIFPSQENLSNISEISEIFPKYFLKIGNISQIS
jgi:hypothetical protein